MNKLKRTFRVRYIVRCVKSILADRVKNTGKARKCTLLIVRLDAIGDYVLFRNFLQLIRTSERFKDYQITLCGNELWRDIACKFDEKFVDAFMWVNTKNFVGDQKYRKEVLQHVADSGFEVAVCPNAARSFMLGDAIVRASHANIRIGSTASNSIDNALFGYIGDQFYTERINTSAPPFEFDKNIVFFEKLLNTKIDLQLPFFDNIEQAAQNYVIILPGAGEPQRQWPVTKFAELTSYLIDHYPYKVLIAGSAADGALAKSIMNSLRTTSLRVEDVTGKTSLSELVTLIGGARLVIAHDSGGLHMAIATKTNVIGLMTGKHFKRFGPYTHQPDNALLIFPKPEEHYETLFRIHGPSYFEGIVNDINEITLQQVIDRCKVLLQ